MPNAPKVPVGGPRLGAPGLVLDAPPGVPAPPQGPAATWLVADAGSGKVLAAKGAHIRLRPASTLKTLTALTILPKAGLDVKYTATYDDAAIEGSRVGLQEGSTYTVRDLLYSIFLVSGNDAANALANVRGGVPAFVREMNARAAELQAFDTLAVNPSGLDAPGQFSSAYDLALFGRAALRTEEIPRYATTRKYALPAKDPGPGKPRGTVDVWNKQKFVRNYPGAVGIKTGYTSQARSTLIAAATRGDRTILVTLMRSQPGAAKEAAALMDWAFKYGDQVSPVGVLVDPVTPAPAATASLQAAPAEPLTGPAAATAVAVGLSNEEGGPTTAALTGVGVLTGAGALFLLRRRRPAARPRHRL